MYPAVVRSTGGSEYIIRCIHRRGHTSGLHTIRCNLPSKIHTNRHIPGQLHINMPTAEGLFSIDRKLKAKFEIDDIEYFFTGFIDSETRPVLVPLQIATLEYDVLDQLTGYQKQSYEGYFEENTFQVKLENGATIKGDNTPFSFDQPYEVRGDCWWE
uniref:ARAD1D00220p n=1 Tax=Blastobotrys adeninivorans TaxID=409370 RepID=A0A060T730_BLAAD